MDAEAPSRRKRTLGLLIGLLALGAVWALAPRVGDAPPSEAQAAAERALDAARAQALRGDLRGYVPLLGGPMDFAARPELGRALLDACEGLTADDLGRAAQAAAELSGPDAKELLGPVQEAILRAAEDARGADPATQEHAVRLLDALNRAQLPAPSDLRRALVASAVARAPSSPLLVDEVRYLERERDWPALCRLVEGLESPPRRAELALAAAWIHTGQAARGVARLEALEAPSKICGVFRNAAGALRHGLAWDRSSAQAQAIRRKLAAGGALHELDGFGTSRQLRDGLRLYRTASGRHYEVVRAYALGCLELARAPGPAPDADRWLERSRSLTRDLLIAPASPEDARELAEALAAGDALAEELERRALLPESEDGGARR